MLEQINVYRKKMKKRFPLQENAFFDCSKIIFVLFIYISKTFPTFAPIIKNKTMNKLLDRIKLDKNVCNGKPSIRGMRFTVSQMLELIASGMTSDEITSDYPYIEADDIAACLYYKIVIY